MRAFNPAKSTQIHEVRHWGDTLEVRFKSGAVYRYSGVPEHEYAALRDAEEGSSVGKVFAARIRGHYPFEKVEDK